MHLKNIFSFGTKYMISFGFVIKVAVYVGIFYCGLMGVFDSFLILVDVANYIIVINKEFIWASSCHGKRGVLKCLHVVYVDFYFCPGYLMLSEDMIKVF